MPGGTPVARPWVVVMKDGTIAVDWGDGLFQEAISGTFFNGADFQVSHRAQDADLDRLVKLGRVACFDGHNAYFINLPERPTKTLE